MAIQVLTNKDSTTSPRFTVRDIFYGRTLAESTSWFVTALQSIRVSLSGTIRYNYLQLKKDETPNVFNRLFYEIDIKANEDTFFNLFNVTPFSLSISGDNSALVSEVIAKLKLISTIGQLPEKFFLDNLDPTILSWTYSDSIDAPIVSPIVPVVTAGTQIFIGSVSLLSSETFTTKPNHKLYPATNDIWNQNIGITGINDLNSPVYYEGDDYVFDRFFKLTSTNDDLENDFTGDLNEMPTSPYILEIHKALDAAKFSHYTPLDSAGNPVLDGSGEPIREPNVANLGFYIENCSRVLGLRFNSKGEIDRKREKQYTRKILTNPSYDKSAYCTNTFGHHGRLTPHLSNSNGEKAYDVIYDIPQMLEACFEHVNRSLGIQQGTEIKIPNSVTGEIDYYPNQHALLLDLHSKVTETNQNSKEGYNLLFTIAQMIRELFSGIGIATVFKSLFTRYGAVPYLGHQVDKGSINTSLTTLKVNLGIVLGNMLQSKPSPKLALSRFFNKSKGKK